MIRVITGYMGSGKSLYAVRWIYRNRKKFKTILTNSPLEFGDVNVIVSPDPLQDVRFATPPILIFLDEVHLIMDSRRAMSKRNVAWTHLLTLIRKMDTEIIMTTQSIPQIDIRLQFFLKTYWEAQGLRWMVTDEGDIQPFFVYDAYKIDFDPWTGERKRFYLHTEAVWYYNAAKYFSLYDTNYIPEFPWEEEQKTIRVNPAALIGIYPKASLLIEKMRQMGLPASQANYRQFLGQMGLAVRIIRKSGGIREYEVYEAKQKKETVYIGG